MSPKREAASGLTEESKSSESFAMQESSYRFIFMLFVAWGALIFWLAPHPPMIDLPQHAGQVILLKDMLLGQSPWADLFRINLLTPYLIGYGLALPLSFIMPIAAALKLLLSTAYVAFVLMCVKLRQHFGADSHLDWLFLLSFFGFAYTWGFFTFLVAAPIGLWFILISDRYAHQQTIRRAAGVTVVGLILLASHGLVFLFSLCVGLALLVARVHQFKALLKVAVPFVILVLACAAYFLISRQVHAGMEAGLEPVIIWQWGLARIPKAFIYTLAAHKDISLVLLIPAVAVILCIPWLLGLRIDWQNRSSWIPFAVLSFVLIFVPTYAFRTSFIYQRFALFLLPAYAWMFTRRSASANPGIASRFKLNPRAAMPLLVLICMLTLSLNTARTWRFGQETADIDTILGNLEPKHRALALMFDPESKAVSNKKMYMHYPAWYQAERHGLVDFNFAWFPPQIVRYRPEHLPAVLPEFEWRPERFDWVKNRGSDYTYFFVRHSGAVPENLFKGANCPPAPLFTRGSWTVFERRTCS
jgi:hypothetical protein